jgi:hypothetical protein
MRSTQLYYDIVRFHDLGDYKMQIDFENGKTGMIDLVEYIAKGGVFARLADPAYYKAYVDESGVLCWPDGLDIAPETLYSKATGEPLPAWMVPGAEELKSDLATANR